MAASQEPNETLQDSIINSLAPKKDDQPPSPQQESSSSISELQSALGPLLLTHPSKPAAPPKSLSSIPYTVHRGCPDDPPPPPPKPHWAGTFTLLSFPRELRERIYHYTVYRPSGIYYTYNNNQHFWSGRRPCTDILHLFLVNRQVYSEASEVFFRSNTIKLNSHHNDRERYNKPLAGMLRLFPDGPARHLRKVGLQYTNEITRRPGSWGWARTGGTGPGGAFNKFNTSGQTFAEILRDAKILEDFFPRLRVFEVVWSVDRGRGEEGDELGVVEIWLGRMRDWAREGHARPSACVKFRLWGWVRDPLREGQEDAFNEAYRRLVGECRGEEDARGSEMQWVEELEHERSSKKKGNKRMVSGIGS